MARRRIGQEGFAFGSSDADRRRSLDSLREVIDWAALERRLASVSCSAKRAGMAAAGAVQSDVACAIDLFFRSLAAQRGDDFAIILSLVRKVVG